MTYSARLILTSVAAACTLMTCLPVSAVTNGVINGITNIIDPTIPGAPPVVNPFTGKETNVWKLVGFSGNHMCTAFRITPEWIGSAIHCWDPFFPPFNDFQGKTSDASGCKKILDSDLQICRLTKPSDLTPLPLGFTFPALSVRPKYDRAAANKYGSFMSYGRSTSGDGLTFLGLNLVPYALNPALTPNLSMSILPGVNGGDSGGANYWFSPEGKDPVLIGWLHTGISADPFTQAILDEIKRIIVANGDPAPVLETTTQYYTGPIGNPAAELQSPPTLTQSSAGLVLNWATPPSSPSVSSFEVTLGLNGVLDRMVTISAGTSNSLPLNNLAAAQYIACALPKNSVGPANAMWLDGFSVNGGNATPNCLRIDNRETQATINGLTGSSSVIASTSSYKASFAWAVTPVPVDLPIKKFRITQTTATPTGPQRTTTVDIATNTTSFTVTKGSKVCLSVSALTNAFNLGPKSSQVCVLAN